MTEQQPSPRPGAAVTFEGALAAQIGPIRAAVDMCLDRNPEMPVALRAALVRISGRLMPLCSTEFLERLRDAYEDGDYDDGEGNDANPDSAPR